MKARYVLSCLLLLSAGCNHREEPRNATPVKPPVAEVRIAVAETRSQPVDEEVVGTIRAKVHAILEAKVSGRIEDLPVLLGQPVKAGELVARLDAAEIQARLEQAQAALEQANRDWNRIASLFKGQAVTRSEYDRADAQQRMAKAAVAEAEAMRLYTEMRAPFAGVVSRKWADVGDLASPGKPLVEIEDPSALQLDADLPEAISMRVHLGAVLAVCLDGVDGAIQGKVAEIAPSADPASRTVKVKLDLPQAPGLMAGRFARVLVPVAEAESLTVPESAVVRRGQLELVFAVANQQAQLHLVKTGKRSGDKVEILSGLETGERVVVEGAGLLLDGQPVTVK